MRLLNYFKELNIVDENKLQLLYDPIVHTRYLGKIKKTINLSNKMNFI